MRKAIFFVSFLLIMLFLNDVASIDIASAITDSTACTYKPIINCYNSPKIARAACEKVIGIAREYTGFCSSTTISLNYNTRSLKCGDVMSLKVAKYAGSSWKPIVATSVSSNGDETGTASAIIDSPGIYAVVANENCVTNCLTNKVYDIPDPTLLSNSVHLGVCGDKFEAANKESSDSEDNSGIIDTELNPDNVAPILFIVGGNGQSDSQYPNQDSNAPNNNDAVCPEGYESGGSFYYDGESSSGYMVAFNKSFNQKTTTKGWITLCTKNDFAYLKATRNDCIYKDGKKIPFLSDSLFGSLPTIIPDSMDATIDMLIAWGSLTYRINGINSNSKSSCGENSVLCSYIHLHEVEHDEEDFFNDLYGCCDLESISAKTSESEKKLTIENSFEDLYCNKEGKSGTSIVNGIHGYTYGSHNLVFIDEYICSILQYANVGNGFVQITNQPYTKRAFLDKGGSPMAIRTIPIFAGIPEIFAGDFSHLMDVLYYFPQKPNYAICGTYFHIGNTDRFSIPHFCSIEQNNPCNDGYELLGSIRVGSFDENRCDNVYGLSSEGNKVNGISKSGQKIEAGLMGLCVKTTEGIDKIKGMVEETSCNHDETCDDDESSDTCDDCKEDQTPVPSSGGEAKGAKFVALEVSSGEATPNKCPEEGYHLVSTISGEGSFDSSGTALDFGYIGSATSKKNIMSGTIGLCISDNKPQIIFCSTDELKKNECVGTEYCDDTTGKLECEYTTEEEGTFNYYAFVCDLFGCPSPKYYGTNSIYYGKGEFSVCSAETCGLTLPITTEITNLSTNVSTLPTTPVNETPSPEPQQNNTECVDNDQDGFYGTDELCQDGNDCNDNNASIHPGTADICGNEIDEDCDGIAAPCEVQCNGTAKDEDQDSYCSDVDCDDNNATIHPDATDVCSNDIDEDCDGKDSICPECTENNILSCFQEKEDYFYTYHTTCSKDGIFGKCTPDYEMNLNPLSPRPSCKDGNNWTCPRQFGVCQGSKTTCSNNQWPDCDYNVMEGYSSAEICDDGLDNDCDGSTDEGCLCNTGDIRQCGSMAGECKQGKQTCNENKWSACDFASGYYPKPEYLLDSKDSDCDGSIDEGLLCFSKYKPGFLRSCGKSNVPPCAYGKQSCTNEIFDNLTIFSICESSIDPKTEICDDTDNDCDGSTDEGCPCEGTQTKKCGIGIGACTYGAQYCKNNTFTDCKGAATPTEEKCGNSIDDDCDGSTDEGCPCTDAGKPVDSRLCTKQLGVCLGFNQTCSNGTFLPCDYSKIPNYEAKEAKCDDLFDNDCDGKLDSLDYDCISTTNTKCTDGTLVESCSVSKPKYCSKDVQLEDKCEECGCPSDYHCSNGACEVIQITPPACDEDNVCDADQGETESNCNDCIEETPEPAEAICGDDSCDVSAGESADTCPNDCPKKSSILIYIIPIIIILIAGLVALFYFKKKKQKPKKEEQKPIFSSEIKQSEIKEVERPAVSMAIAQPNKSSISQLQEYLKRNLQQGKKIEDLKVASIKAGWSPEDIETAMRAIKPEVSRKNALSSLYSYVYTQLAKGLPEVMIRDKLRKAGWSPSDIEKTISYSKDSLKQLQERKNLLSSMQKDEEWAEKQLKSKLEEEKPVKKPSKQNKSKKQGL